MTAESILVGVLGVLVLQLVLTGLALILVVNNLREMRSEQQATRRALSNMDWTTVLSNMQAHAKESVRILDILDKRLQKLEALEKILLAQTNPNNRG
jgi:hypothetical protein